MVYIFAFVGIISGFAIGLGVINVALRHYTMKEIKADKSLKWKSGLSVWIFAGFGGWLGTTIYNNYFY